MLTKQFQINNEEETIRIIGTLDGKPYGAKIDLKNSSAKWECVEGTQVGPDPLPGVPSASAKAAREVFYLAKGGIGLAKAALGLGKASSDTVDKRKSICLNCPSGCYDFGICRRDIPDRPQKEQGCGCVLPLKVLQKNESCPHGHWGREE